jgi:hypothetical protein
MTVFVQLPVFQQVDRQAFRCLSACQPEVALLVIMSIICSKMHNPVKCNINSYRKNFVTQETFLEG